MNTKNCPILPKTIIHFLLAILLPGIMLTACEETNNKSQSNTEDLAKSNGHIYFSYDMEALQPYPHDGTRPVADSLSFTLSLSTKNKNQKGESPSIVSIADSISFDTKVETYGCYYLDSVHGVQFQPLLPCSPGTILSGAVSFSEHSMIVTIPCRLRLTEQDCHSSTISVAGSLIVLVEEAMPDPPGKASLDNFKAWKNGEPVPFTRPLF